MDEEYVVCALIHDIGDILCSASHADLGATIMKPYVSEANYWTMAHHGIFQGYYFFHYLGLDRDMRDQFRGHPHFERTAMFCARHDQNAFDPGFRHDAAGSVRADGAARDGAPEEHDLSAHRAEGGGGIAPARRYGISTVAPVVSRDCSASCALAASASLKR